MVDGKGIAEEKKNGSVARVAAMQKQHKKEIGVALYSKQKQPPLTKKDGERTGNNNVTAAYLLSFEKM